MKGGKEEEINFFAPRTSFAHLRFKKIYKARDMQRISSAGVGE